RLPEKLPPSGETAKARDRRRSIVVHQFGFPALAFPGDLSDAACAAGVPQAMEGACACLPFHPRKVITTGEGGAVVADDEQLLAKRSAPRSPTRESRPRSRATRSTPSPSTATTPRSSPSPFACTTRRSRSPSSTACPSATSTASATLSSPPSARDLLSALHP